MTPRDALGRLASLVARRHRLRRYDDEVEAHLALAADDLQRRGMTPDEARHEARRQFGGIDQARERFRDASGVPALDALAQDVRHGARTVRRQPGFSLLVVVLIALGVGANTAIFSLVSAILLRPLPYPDPLRLVVVRSVVPTLAATYPSLPVAAGAYERFAAGVPAFSSMAAIRPVTETLTGTGEPARVHVGRVTPSLFPLLGMQASLGRLLGPDDDRPGAAADVVVLTHAFWMERFGGDDRVLGRALRLDDRVCTVVGVLAPGFRFPRHEELGSLITLPDRLDALRPAAFTEDERQTTVGDFDWAVIARLAPGASMAQARSQLDAIQAAIMREAGVDATLQAAVVPLHEQVVGHARRGLILLGWSVGLVMLVLAVNLANLLLARVASRAREASVRRALGASRWRIARQIVIENLLLGVAGGLLGLAVAWALLHALAAGAPLDLPRLDEVGLDPRVTAFGLAVAVLTGLVFSLLPAWRLGNANPHVALRASGRTSSDGAAPLRLRGMLVTAEVALSTVLLAAATLFGASFLRLLHVDRGFITAQVLFVELAPPATKYASTEAQVSLYDRLLAAVRSLPAIGEATLVSEPPLAGEAHVRTISVEHDQRPIAERPVLNIRYIDGGYFHAVGIPVVRGRAFDDRDRPRRVILLNARAAEALWPGQRAVGRFVRWGSDERPRPPFEVVGVVGDAREVSLYKVPYLMGYVPYWTGDLDPGVSLVLKTALDAPAVASSVRQAIRAVEPQMPPPAVTSFAAVVDQAVEPERFQFLLVGAFAASALLLAALGIYGVPAFAVARRSQELGIRLALGASPRALVRMVVREGLHPVAIGLALGLAGAIAAERAIRSVLFDAGGATGWVLAGVAAIVTAIALVACYVPARRISRIDPAQSLRAD